MHTELRLSRHCLHSDEQIIEVWFDRQLIGTVAPSLFGPGVQIVTAFPAWVGMQRDDPPEPPVVLNAHASIGDSAHGLRVVSVVITPE